MSAGLHPLESDWLTSLREMRVLPPIPPIEQWVRDQRIEITTDQNSTYAGEYYDPARGPVVSRLVFGFFEDPAARELIALKPVQSMFTTTVFLALAHALVFRPGSAVYAMHTRDEARKKMTDTIRPTLRQIPELAKSEAEATDDSTSEVLRLNGGRLAVGGGQTAALFTGTHHRYVICDEAQQHEPVGETTTFNLGRGRLTGSDDGKLVVFSKPEKEAVWERDPKTNQYGQRTGPDGKTDKHASVDAEYCSGNQLRYECPCPNPECGKFTEPKFRHLRFSHCNEALPGTDPQYNLQRILKETFFECPHCQGRVHEGEEKKRWVLAGRWIETPAAERRGKEKYPVGIPGRISAQFSALTDIAFSSLHWGRIVLRFLDAQNDPAKLRAFKNEIEGLGEPEAKIEDTTLDQVRKLIPSPASNDPPPWRMKTERGELTRRIPILSTQLDYVGMQVDGQKERLKYTVFAFGKDGRSYLLDYGMLPVTPDFIELRTYFDTMTFTTPDGVEGPVYKCYIDVGGEFNRFHDVLELTLAYATAARKIEGCKGEGGAVRMKGLIWPNVSGAKSGRPAAYWMFDSPWFEEHLYVKTIQKHDPRRHRHWAPAMHFPSDVQDDFLVELTRMKQVWVNREYRWEKVSQSAIQDYGDCCKMRGVMDQNLGCRHASKDTPPPDDDPPPPAPGLQPGENPDGSRTYLLGS